MVYPCLPRVTGMLLAGNLVVVFFVAIDLSTGTLHTFPPVGGVAEIEMRVAIVLAEDMRPGWRRRAGIRVSIPVIVAGDIDQIVFVGRIAHVRK